MSVAINLQLSLLILGDWQRQHMIIVHEDGRMLSN